MVANPDEIENVQSQYRQSCGRDLSDIEGELDYMTQEIDLPPIRPVYRERRFYKRSVLAAAAIVAMNRAAKEDCSYRTAYQGVFRCRLR